MPQNPTDFGLTEMKLQTFIFIAFAASFIIQLPSMHALCWTQPKHTAVNKISNYISITLTPVLPNYSHYILLNRNRFCLPIAILVQI